MKPSKQFLSLPIVSLSEGQHIGYVKSLVIDSQSKALAALVIDPKGFFKDQRIIPYAKVVSVGADAITIDKGSYVEKSASLPEILSLIKEKLTIIGTRVITQSGKTLGVVEEFYVDPDTGKITQMEISGGKIEGFFSGKAILDADYVVTIGQDVIVAQKGCETSLMIADKGINDTFKSVFRSTSSLASGTGQAFGKMLSKNKNKDLSKHHTKGKHKGKGKNIEAESVNPIQDPPASKDEDILSPPNNQQVDVAILDEPSPESPDAFPAEQSPEVNPEQSQVAEAPSTKEPVG
ncbi:hypothetical protein Desde_0094 [Desulfitobacterium dehalogenans ATCC 51507]|uniref:PRC-barrel domain-containing protein n=1 Tax=Desulfitobacterium dehalogenans (strain ATCC 51507 / DSM 9161 / JW/IU-DC1) TaxID=756499 RepID=I4A3Q4_DESDJ|nr:PRC-barrel domain-containing protein [Desulfitobacterium dehalogenans]AFL98588.1 hypothetical protein Desde_0094 [Desulfitobacterium dehalogenans ATCC 51507]